MIESATITSSQPPVRVALIGCGAVARHYYLPLLAKMGRLGLVQPVAVLDPERRRAEALGKTLAAPVCDSMVQVCAARPELAIVASPPAAHADQTIELLAGGSAVLCEKPLALSVSEAGRMAQAAEDSGRLLSVSLVRRFFPAAGFIAETIAAETLGQPLSFTATEGGVFAWPCESAALFDSRSAGGGILIDLGIHLLDLLIWWFGEPASLEYADDAMGGIEANALVTMGFAGGVAGTMRLSRDCPIKNRLTIRFAHGSLSWDLSTPDHLTMQAGSGAYELSGTLITPETPSARIEFLDAFYGQLDNVVRAVRGIDRLRVGAADAIASLAIVERCYQGRKLMDMPWLSSEEQRTGQLLSEGVGS